jgi:hypothetical protein
MDRDEKLFEFATDKQREYLEAYWAAGSYRAAAKALDVHVTTVKEAINSVLKKAALRGYAPPHDLVHELPDGLVLKGTSLRYNKDGEVEQYWNKSRMDGRDPSEVVQLPDPKKITKLSTLYDQQGRVSQQWVAEKPELAQREELWKIFADELKKDLPRVAPVELPPVADVDLLAAYPVGDHHYGMYAWNKDAGGDYDLTIAEELLNRAFDHLVRVAPPCHTALLPFLGDLFHYDSMEPVTPTSRNQLDADSRFPKMVRVVLRGIRYAIDAALKKHYLVHVIIEIGNHDLATSIFLMEALAAIYENEPRVKIDTSPKHFHFFEFGKNLIGTHHGHGVKLEALPIIMAHDQAEAWGRSAHRCWWTGHIHQKKVFEVGGVEIESFRVLGPTDAWAHQRGYRSKRSMTGIVLHKEYGEVARNTVNPIMLRRG